MQTRDDVVVVGGGAVGLASALALAQAGRQVRVLEARSTGSGSSHGNCGTLTPSHSAPLAAPGTVAKALKWMFTPDAPFYVAPRVDPALWRWFARFAQRCNARDWHAAMRAKAAILLDSRAAFPGWIAAHAPGSEFQESGVDYVFRDPARLAAFRHELAPLAELGVASEVIDGDAYLRGEPALKPGVVAAVRFAGDARLRPDRYVAGLAASARAAGVVIDEGREVMAIHGAAPQLRVSTAAGTHFARDVVVATGAWSPALARASGFAAPPIQPGKGYSITYARPDPAPRHPLVLIERSVCVTTWESGFRLGSTMEFSGYDSSLNRRRLDALERGAAEYLHAPVGPRKVEEWFGWRPLTPDDLPLIGPVPSRPGLWLATGHGMLGISMSPGTADMVAALVCGRAPRIDPAPYAPSRFA